MSDSQQPTTADTTPEETKQGPSELNGQIKAAQGAVYTAIGSVIPEAAGSSSWIESGQQLSREGQTELNNAKSEKAVEATVDAGAAKLKSAYGYVVGDQSKQTEGNLENEEAQWQYKQATSDSILEGIPVPSAEGVKGKVESVVGMVTGDQGKQKEGNLRAEKAAWRDGV